MAISQIAALTAHISFLLWQLHIWQTRSWQIYCPSSDGKFTDSCFTLRAHIWADQVLADHPLNQMAISQIAALTAHISFLLWELNIWQTRSLQIYPPVKWQFYRFLWNSYFIPTLRAHHLADHVLTDLPPSNGDFTDSCSYSSLLWELIIWQTRSKQIYPPHQMAISQITVKFIFHSYSESSTFGWPGLGRSTHPLSNGNFTDSCSDSSLLWELNNWQTSSWQIYPLSNGNFTDCCSDSSYFIPTLRANHLADQVLTDLPTHQMAILQIPALTAPYSKRSTFDRPGLCRSDPPHQMEISLIPEKFIFHSYSESSTFGWPGLGRSMNPYQMAISQIPALLWKLIFVRPSVGRSTPTHQW